MIYTPLRPLACAQLPSVSRSAILRSAVALPIITRSKPLMAAAAKEPAYEAWVSRMHAAQPLMSLSFMAAVVLLYDLETGNGVYN